MMDEREEEEEEEEPKRGFEQKHPRKAVAPWERTAGGWADVGKLSFFSRPRLAAGEAQSGSLWDTARSSVSLTWLDVSGWIGGDQWRPRWGGTE